MDFKDVRKKFLDFFERKGHVIVKSSSLIPSDPSVLLTTAGMQQFKKYYTGVLDAKSDFGSHRTTSLQKCFRTSDVEEVGDDTHLTFFEMMGNFSFGAVGNDDPKDFSEVGYFKRSAIVWAYEFITDILEISPERIYVTVFEGDEKNGIPKDEESYAIWYKEVGIPKEKIFYGNKEDNFWGPTGNEGPCGPTTEIYVAASAQDAREGKGVEIWNLVFNQFYKTQTNADFAQTDAEKIQAVYTKMDAPGIDTGMGFERLVSMIEGVENVYQTSIFSSIIKIINEIAPGISEREGKILADHIRSSVFLIADGIIPSNKEAGYILRRLLRRIIAIKIKNDIHADIFHLVYEELEDLFGEFYPEIKKEKEILSVWYEENTKFQDSISKGLKELSKYESISGKDAFYLYETFGLPFELIKEMAPAGTTRELSYTEFEEEFKKHQNVSRAGAENKFGGHGLLMDTGEIKAGSKEDLKKVIRMHTATHLLQWALRKVLGESVRQSGSDINPERLRFDFSFERKMSAEEITEVEKIINEQIKKDLPVYFKEMSKEEAEKIGALSFFKEKYPQIVKVYFIGKEGEEISKEFCGGPHVSSTMEIGTFKITKEESVGKGVRRIRATVSE